MTVGEVIKLLTLIFETLMKYLGDIFGKSDEEGTTDEEATV